MCVGMYVCMHACMHIMYVCNQCMQVSSLQHLKVSRIASYNEHTVVLSDPDSAATTATVRVSTLWMDGRTDGERERERDG